MIEAQPELEDSNLQVLLVKQRQCLLSKIGLENGTPIQ
jgi:hypothetical protein